jgi:TorA maturation chaperone TorD
MPEPTAMQITAAERAKTYGFLSALYSVPPAGPLIASILKGTLPEEVGSDPEDAASKELAAFVKAAAALPNLETELAAEHTRLFVLPSGVHPYESFYLDEARRVGGRITVGVKKFYDYAGARLTPACLDLPDHMGMELEFMRFLCSIEADLWRGPDWRGLSKCATTQQSFLSEHLLRWHRPLCERIRKDTRWGLFRALALLTSQFLESEESFVPQSLGEIGRQGSKTCACG